MSVVFKSHSKFIFIIVSCILFACTTAQLVQPAIEETPAKLARGRELVMGLSACGYCHGSTRAPDAQLSGGREFSDKFGSVQAPNLTPDDTGLSDWKAEDIIHFLRSFERPDGTLTAPEYHRGYGWMPTEDLEAISLYLLSLESIENETGRRTLGFLRRNTLGFFEGWEQVRGFVPVIPERYEGAYSKKLIENVARCTLCHNGPGGIFSDEEFLVGGKAVPGASGAYGPALVTPEGKGIDRERILEFFNSSSGSDCPTNFYALADRGDLEGIASYIASISKAQDEG